MFSSKATIRLHHTDAAAVLFFADYFRVAHDAYEDFLEEIGYPIRTMIDESGTLLLIVHAESDYRMPLTVGEKISTEIVVDKIGGSSFVLSYVVRSAEGEIAANLKTVHVAAERKTGKKCTLPAELAHKLKSHLS